MLIYAAPSEQQTVTPAIVSGNSSSNNVVKASNGSGGKVMHRVITMTAASHDTSLKAPVKPAPAYVPEKLHFSAYEKFEGENCLPLAEWPCRKESQLLNSVHEGC